MIQRIRRSKKSRWALPVVVSIIVNTFLMAAAIQLITGPLPSASAEIVVELERPVLEEKKEPVMSKPAPAVKKAAVHTRPAVETPKTVGVEPVLKGRKIADLPKRVNSVSPVVHENSAGFGMENGVPDTVSTAPGEGPGEYFTAFGAGRGEGAGTGNYGVPFKESTPGRAGPGALGSGSGSGSLGSGKGSGSQQAGSSVKGESRGVQIIEQFRPEYPHGARDEGIEGTVTVLVSIDERGKPFKVKIEQSAGDLRLDKAAARAVKEWKYNPRLEDGTKVESSIRVRVQFRLD